MEIVETIYTPFQKAMLDLFWLYTATFRIFAW